MLYLNTCNIARTRAYQMGKQACCKVMHALCRERYRKKGKNSSRKTVRAYAIYRIMQASGFFAGVFCEKKKRREEKEM